MNTWNQESNPTNILREYKRLIISIENLGYMMRNDPGSQVANNVSKCISNTVRTVVDNLSESLCRCFGFIDKILESEPENSNNITVTVTRSV
jgi:hypothetical protein